MYYRIKFIYDSGDTGLSTATYRSYRAAKKAADIWETSIPDCTCKIIKF